MNVIFVNLKLNFKPFNHIFFNPTLKLTKMCFNLMKMLTNDDENNKCNVQCCGYWNQVIKLIVL
jgi:hypothetical protein